MSVSVRNIWDAFWLGILLEVNKKTIKGWFIRRMFIGFFAVIGLFDHALSLLTLTLYKPKSNFYTKFLR